MSIHANDFSRTRKIITSKIFAKDVLYQKFPTCIISASNSRTVATLVVFNENCFQICSGDQSTRRVLSDVCLYYIYLPCSSFLPFDNINGRQFEFVNNLTLLSFVFINNFSSIHFCYSFKLLFFFF